MSTPKVPGLFVTSGVTSTGSCSISRSGAVTGLPAAAWMLSAAAVSRRARAAPTAAAACG